MILSCYRSATEGYNHDAAELMDGGSADITCVGLEDDTVAIEGYCEYRLAFYLPCPALGLS